MGHMTVISGGMDRPSPGLVDAIEQLAHVLHPNAFKEKSENGRVKMENELRLHAATGMREEFSKCAR